MKNFLKNIIQPKYILILIIGIFTIFASHLVLNLRMGLSPDSTYHPEVSRAYTTTWGIPENTEETYQFRDITRIPYLSFWVNARLMNLNNQTLNINEVHLLRFFNLMFAVGTLIFTYLISKVVIKGKWSSLLPTFLLANTLMFISLSSAINYDNMANFFATVSIYFFVKYLKQPKQISNTILMFFALTIATLTKSTILPLALVATIIWAYILLKKKILNMEYITQLKQTKNILILIPLILFIYLNISLYLPNIMDFGSLEPDCIDMLTHEQCLQNGVYNRDINMIPVVFEGGFIDTVKLILDGERMNPITYLPFWITEMSRKIFGIMGDKSLYMEYDYLPFYFAFGILGIYLIIKNRSKLGRVDKSLIIISSFYALFLMMYHNYDTYIKHDWPDLALQGRYIFPVLVPIYVIFSKYFVQIKNKKILYILTTILILGFILGSYVYFLVKVPSDWYFN